jgi:hypothetical protein
VRKDLAAQYQRLAEAHDKRDLKAIVAPKTALNLNPPPE